MKSFILLSFLFLKVTLAGKIVEIQTKTNGNEWDAWMDSGHLDLVICGTDLCCLIDDLDSPLGNDFQWNALDSFIGGALQGCQDFDMPGDILKSFILAHRGPDAWLGDYVNILLDSGRFHHCLIPGWLDESEQFYLTCE